jgi:hypothetical protein
MDSERLFESDGSWHRGQRNRVPFETACYYTHEPELPYGCQRSKKLSDEWTLDGTYYPADPVGWWVHDDRSTRVRERNALIALYEATGGTGWRASDNWVTDSSGGRSEPCWDFWYGVTCDEHGHVIALELSDNRLVGSLPTALGDLWHLMKLDLSSTSSAYHTHVNVDTNALTGALPSLAKATRLAEIEISGNQFQSLPDDLSSSWQTLRVLSASNNLLTTLPNELYKLSKLHTLELSFNAIKADLKVWSSDFGNLAEARYVHVDNNALYGDVTDDIIGMKKILVFDISHNPDLTGEIPEDIITEWAEAEYISILNTSIVGYHSSLCIDQPFCWKYMYSTHADMTWATADDVTQDIYDTIAEAVAAR